MGEAELLSRPLSSDGVSEWEPVAGIRKCELDQEKKGLWKAGSSDTLQITHRGLYLILYVSVAPQKQSSKRLTGPLLFERNYCGLVMIKEVITLPAITESPCSNLVVANSLSWERRKTNKFAQVRKNKLHVCKFIQTESSKCLISYTFSNFVTPTRIFRRQDLSCACLALQKLPAQTSYLPL